MREIKFRAWEDSPELEEPQMHSHSDLDRLDTEGLVHLFEIINGREKHFKIMQYTGLKDRNGVEIYEGDIVKCLMAYKESSLPHMGEIVYHKNFASFATKNDAGETLLCNHLLNTFEVIGNIYEHSELIK